MVNRVAAVVNGTSETGNTPMTAALNYLSRMTDEIFESRMRRAAHRITTRQQIFLRRAA
jgi:hypothetical protein